MKHWQVVVFSFLPPWTWPFRPFDVFKFTHIKRVIQVLIEDLRRTGVVLVSVYSMLLRVCVGNNERLSVLSGMLGVL